MADCLLYQRVVRGLRREPQACRQYSVNAASQKIILSPKHKRTAKSSRFCFKSIINAINVREIKIKYNSENVYTSAVVSFDRKTSKFDKSKIINQIS